MNTNEYNDPKNSLVLFGLGSKLDFLIELYNSNRLPQVLMISGKKGVGKFTLINHFLSYIYDKTITIWKIELSIIKLNFINKI